MNDKGQNNPLYKHITFFYIFIMGFYQVSDKLYGSGFVAFMNLRGISMVQIGFVLSISQLVQAVFDYPSGNVADKIGRKRTSGIGFIIWGISLMLFVISKSVIMFIFSTTILAIGIAFISGAFQAWYIDELISLDKFEYRAKIIPRARGVFMTFSIIGALLASYLVNKNVELPILIAGIIAIIVGIVSIFMFNDNYGEISGKSLLNVVINNTKLFIRDKKMIMMVLKSATFYFGYCIFILFWQIYVIKYLKLQYSYLGVILTVMMIITTLSNFVVGFIGKFMSLYKISITGLIICFIGILVLAMKISTINFFIGIILFELGLGMENTSTSVWIHEHIKSENRSSFLSALSSMEALSGFLITICVGYIIEKFMPSTVWISAAISILLSLIVLCVFISNYRNEKIEEL